MHLTDSDLAQRWSWTRRMVFRGGLLLAGALSISVLAGSTRGARADEEVVPPRFDAVAGELRSLTHRLEASEGQLAVAKVQIARSEAIFRYSSQYSIPADLSAAIYDVALSEGINPAIGFRLVKVESNFVARATSPVGAVGYTQIRLPTARYYEPGLELEQLYARDVNLRLGFRFLKDLMDKYDKNAALALVAYNRGPARVQAILDQGGDPSNGYAQNVLRGVPKSKIQ